MKPNSIKQIKTLIKDATIVNMDEFNDVTIGHKYHQQLRDIIKSENPDLIILEGDLEIVLKDTTIETGVVLRLGVYQDFIEAITFDLKDAKNYIEEQMFLKMLTNPLLAKCSKVFTND